MVLHNLILSALTTICFLVFGDGEILFNDTFIDNHVPYLLTLNQEYTVNFTNEETLDQWLINGDEFTNSDTVLWEIWNQTSGRLMFRYDTHIFTINVCRQHNIKL